MRVPKSAPSSCGPKSRARCWSVRARHAESNSAYERGVGVLAIFAPYPAWPHTEAQTCAGLRTQSGMAVAANAPTQAEKQSHRYWPNAVSAKNAVRLKLFKATTLPRTARHHRCEPTPQISRFCVARVMLRSTQNWLLLFWPVGFALRRIGHGSSPWFQCRHRVPSS